MNTIDFSNIRRELNTIYFDVRSSKRDSMETLSFSTSFPAYRISDTAIACVMATICGQGYQKVCADITLTENAKNQLEVFTKAVWSVKRVVSEKSLRNLAANVTSLFSNHKKTAILNFSGGFDSLAAKALMPDDTELVSVDFGGWFDRETRFFSTFNTNIVKTNFRQLKYDRESWTFVGVGSLLLAEVLNAQYNVMGTIFEATQWHFKPEAFTTSRLPFSIMGMQEARITNGLTEVGTAMVVSCFYPEYVLPSIESLASEGSEKKYRKQVLTSIVCEKYNRNVQITKFSEPKSDQIMPWGSNFARDFLALYELKHVGKDTVGKTVSDIPGEAVKLSQKLSLRFYERLNPKFMDSIPTYMKTDYFARLKKADILPYDCSDAEEFNAVRELLTKYYPGVK